MTRLCAVTHWFGPMPRYARLFFQTAAENPDLRVILVGDQLPADLPPNVIPRPTTLAALRARVRERTGLDVAVGRADQPYKLCDARPAFGEAFADEIGDAPFWAFLDLDHILGDVCGAVERAGGFEADVCGVRGPWWLSGSFAVFRNTPRVNALYRRIPGLERDLADPVYRGIEEVCFRFDGVERRVADLVAGGQRVSFTDVLREAADAGEIRLAMPHLTAEPNRYWDAHYHYRREGGRMNDLRTGAEVFAVHLVRAKAEPMFALDRWDALPARVDVTGLGVTAVGPNGERSRSRDVRVVAQGLPRTLRHAAGRALWRVRTAMGLTPSRIETSLESRPPP